MAAATIGVIGLGTQGAFAGGGPSSTLVATSIPSPLVLEIVGGVHATGTVTANLDSGCLSALNNGLSYTITALSSDTAGGVAVSPAQSDPLRCVGSTSKKGGATSATFTVTAQCLSSGGFTSSANIGLQPVVGPQGIQNKLSGTSVPVTVNNTDGSCGSPSGQCISSCGPAGTNPAAPAVTNGYLDAGASSTCQPVFSALAGKAWRGALISFIAHWMPTPESVKDNTSVFPNDNVNGDTWVQYVQTEVNFLCSISGTVYPTPAGMPSDQTAYSG